eukprot:gene8770-18140_t
MVAKITNNVRVPFWMAFHDIKSSINGAEWYKTAWEGSTYECLDLYDHIIDLLPCNRNSWVIQIGAHLGIYPQLGASRGCSAISVEGNKVHIPLIQLTVELNHHQNIHHVVHAAGGSQRGEIYFGKDHIYNSIKDIPPNNLQFLQRSNVITIDDLLENFTQPHSKVNIMIIDVEGYENNVLLGAKISIQSQRIMFFNIEVWIRNDGQDVTDFSGLELLEQAGYKLYIGRNYPIKNKNKYKMPRPISVEKIRSGGVLRRRICKISSAVQDKTELKSCLFDLYALHPSLKPTEVYMW